MKIYQKDLMKHISKTIKDFLKPLIRKLKVVLRR